MSGLETRRPKRVRRAPSHLLRNDGGKRVAKTVIHNTRSYLKQHDLQGQHKGKPRTLKRIPTVSVHSLQGGSGRMAGINSNDDGGPHLTVSELEQVQQCCVKSSAALQQYVEQGEQFRSTIQVLQEALHANISQFAALKLEAHRSSGELEAVKKENERVTADLNQMKAGNTSRINGIMKTVGGFFVRSRNN
ncbi:hypothetical protein V496_02118 [Pseudogymnoascus sp. VKM F-4515 (FW-2607)]|nr:hypothetical protein V496_02118 [Pseudogymnoascus sp. VKM F-4515 (FW-2607)]